MQIENPKSSPPPAAILAIIAVAVLIFALPFLAKSARPKTSSQADLTQVEKVVVAPIPKVSLLPEKIPATAAKSLVAQSSDLVSEIKKVSPAIAKPLNAASSAKEPAALLTSFYGNVKVIGPNGEEKTEKNRQILKGETIEVGATGEAVLEIEELYVLRLKPNTKLTQLEAHNDQAFSGKERVTYRFKLEQGALLGTTKYRGDKVNMLDLLIKDKVFNVQDSTFRVQLSDSSPWIGVLRGNVKSNVESASSQKPVVIHALEKVSLSDSLKPEVINAPVKVSEEEWGLLKETYEMNMKTAAEEAKQIDLSKKAGNFFENVFDHGTFYTENVGYTVRDFYEDKASGDVYLEAEYDVFPANSFVGLYVLTRDLDAKNYSGLRFDVRRKPDEGYPDRFYVEIKSKGQIIHRFEITDVKPEWGARQIDFFTPVSTPITEVTLVFLNESIGQSKKGYIQMRNVQMIPLTDDQKSQRAEAEKNPAPAKLPKILNQAPRSMNQAVVTESLKTAKKVAVEDEEAESVPYQTDSSRKIAQEVPKVVSFDDLSQ